MDKDVIEDKVNKIVATNQYLKMLLKDATSRLEEYMETDCECDNTHINNGTSCCLCEYHKAIK